MLEHHYHLVTRRNHSTLLIGFVLLTILGLPANFGCKSPTKGKSGNWVKPISVTTKSGVEMIFLAGGKFSMGSDTGDSDEKPSHEVDVSPFLMDVHEVTHAMFKTAEMPNPSKWQDDDQKPVESLRWRDAKMYCNERSLMEGLTPCYDETKSGLPCNFEANGYRLPTEAEWEFACKANGNKSFDFGDDGKLGEYSIFSENSNNKTHPVKSRKPNGFGIYGLYGNVSEWCQDVYDETYYQESEAKDPTGPESTSDDVKRVIRGGSWKAAKAMCRSTFRQGQRTGDTDACFSSEDTGFRCVRRITKEELVKLQNNDPPADDEEK